MKMLDHRRFLAGSSESCPRFECRSCLTMPTGKCTTDMPAVAVHPTVNSWQALRNPRTRGSVLKCPAKSSQQICLPLRRLAPQIAAKRIDTGSADETVAGGAVVVAAAPHIATCCIGASCGARTASMSMGCYHPAGLSAIHIHFPFAHNGDAASCTFGTQQPDPPKPRRLTSRAANVSWRSGVCTQNDTFIRHSGQQSPRRVLPSSSRAKQHLYLQ